MHDYFVMESQTKSAFFRLKKLLYRVTTLKIMAKEANNNDYYDTYYKLYKVTNTKQ
jgi:hypothetical protein